MNAPTAVDIATVDEADHADLTDLLLSIPPGERHFVKEEIGDERSVRSLLDRASATWRIARLDGEPAGAVAVVRGHGWSEHVGEIRMVVAPRFRRQGVGAVLAREGLLAAVEEGALVVTVEALAEQQGVIDLFRGLGFVPEALLSDHVRTGDGSLHDLVVMTQSIDASSARADLVALGEVT